MGAEKLKVRQNIEASNKGQYHSQWVENATKGKKGNVMNLGAWGFPGSNGKDLVNGSRDIRNTGSTLHQEDAPKEGMQFNLKELARELSHKDRWPQSMGS